MNTSPLRHPVRLLYEGAEMPITQIQKWHRKHQIGKVPCRSIPFGPERNQKIVVFEPERRLHDTVILYFHGGGYLVGTPESMDIGAFFFTERGYRFISLGYRLLSQAAFPAQIEDAYAGYEAQSPICKRKARSRRWSSAATPPAGSSPPFWDTTKKTAALRSRASSRLPASWIRTTCCRGPDTAGRRTILWKNRGCRRTRRSFWPSTGERTRCPPMSRKNDLSGC